VKIALVQNYYHVEFHGNVINNFGMATKSLKIISCPPSWIHFYVIIGDVCDVKSVVIAIFIKLHLNDQITVSLV
jgi:hypothetical protein